MKRTLELDEISERLSRAALNLKNAGDVSAAKHIQFALSLILRMADADGESLDPSEENDGR